MTVALRLLPIVLRACPREFRRTDGEAIRRADFRETIAHECAHHGALGGARAVAAAYADILASGLSERALRKTPFSAAFVVATWAISIAATTVAFSIVDGVLLRHRPYRAARSLVALEARSHDSVADVFSYPNDADLAARSRAFAAIGAGTLNSASLTGAGSARVLTGMRVSPSFFAVFGVRAEIGRLVTEADSRPGFARVVVISDALYRSGFAATPTVISRRQPNVAKSPQSRWER